jgi:hypothetical protein
LERVPARSSRAQGFGEEAVLARTAEEVSERAAHVLGREVEEVGCGGGEALHAEVAVQEQRGGVSRMDEAQGVRLPASGTLRGGRVSFIRGLLMGVFHVVAGVLDALQARRVAGATPEAPAHALPCIVA